MGYFSNGTEGDMYIDRYCFKCLNRTTREGEGGDGCPIWDLHMVYNYTKDTTIRMMLNEIIPRDEKGYNLKCKMFLERVK